MEMGIYPSSNFSHLTILTWSFELIDKMASYLPLFPAKTILKYLESWESYYEIKEITVSLKIDEYFFDK